MKVQVKSLQPSKQQKVDIYLSQHTKLLTVAFIMLCLVCVVLIIGTITLATLFGGVR